MSNLFWLADEQLVLIEAAIPKHRRGVKPRRNREVISGIIHVLKVGSRWEDCPPEYGPHPLPADVGEAVAAYLRRGRPRGAQGRTVFITVKAPYQALTSTAVSVIVGRAAKRCGLGTLHAHRLRHTAATMMLRGGASLPEIGQLLRHRNAITTAIYAKVDSDALRSIARPWPGDVG
jgi:hypothetical protein